MPTSHDVVPGNIRAEMARRGVRQIDVAHRLGITQQALSGKLKGRRPINVDELRTIADALGLEPADLLTHPTDSSARSAS